MSGCQTPVLEALLLIKPPLLFMGNNTPGAGNQLNVGQRHLDLEFESPVCSTTPGVQSTGVQRPIQVVWSHNSKGYAIQYSNLHFNMTIVKK